jgi:membrane associated rhomboid family serine protease
LRGKRRLDMGISDRDYHRQDRRDGGGIFAHLTPVVMGLLILNLGIYFVDMLLEAQQGERPMRNFGSFTIQSGVLDGKIWEFITFQFLHGSVMHVLFNCMGIFFFGPWMERWWDSRKFLAFYLLSGAAGAAFYTLLVYLKLLPLDSLNTPLVGASAGIYGILMGVAVVAPDLRVRLFFPPIELSMRQLAMVLIAISAGSILLKWGGNEGGEAGHLGGALLGFILVRFPWLLHWKMPVALGGSGAAGSRVSPKQKLTRENEEAAAVDAILDKISSHGFQSLTQTEKDFLQKISDSKKSG